MDSNISMGIAIALLILLSAFFSAMETAFSFVNKIRVQHAVENGDKKAAKVLYVIEHFDKALTAILICNNIVNLGCSSIATVLCLNLFGDIGSAIATGVTTLLVLTFGEVIPKCLAKEHCDAFAGKTAGILKFLTIILTPLVFIFMKLRAVALKIAGSSEDAPSVTENELKYIVESIEEEGVLEESESEMVRSALDFDETTAEEILTPRVDVVFINIEDSQQKIKEIIIENRYSRIPVYENTIDNIVGILHTRDYLESLADGKAPALKDIMQPPFFVFRTQQLSKILSSFKRTKDHMAIVTDEYGGTSAPRITWRSSPTNTAAPSVSSPWRICSRRSSAISGTRTRRSSTATTRSARMSSSSTAISRSRTCSRCSIRTATHWKAIPSPSAV